MKTIFVALLIVVAGITLWHPADLASGESNYGNLIGFTRSSSSCGCLQITDLQNRLKAVNAALTALEQQQSAERWQVPFSQASYQNDLLPIISLAIGNSRVGAMGRLAGNLDPSSCAIRPDSPPVTGCFADLIAKNLENRKENCESWKNDPDKTGNDYRGAQSMSDVIGELLTSYYAEQGLIEEKLTTLTTQCGNRGNANGIPRGIPPMVPPSIPPIGGTSPPTRTPPSTVPPGGRRSGTGTGGGPAGNRRITGYVQYIFEGVMEFPELGKLRLWSDSRIPFTITQGRVSGTGTIETELDTSQSQCTDDNYHAKADIVVSGRLIGNNMDVTISPATSTPVRDAENVSLICRLGGQNGMAANFPWRDPNQNRGYTVQQRLPLPRAGGPPTVTTIPMNVGGGGFQVMTGSVTLKVFVP